MLLAIRNNKVNSCSMTSTGSFNCIQSEDGLSFSKQNNAISGLVAKADK